MQFEWDEEKREANLAKHGVDFADAEKLDWETAGHLQQTHGPEQRTLTFALLAERLHAIVWTQRGPNKRIISMRKANRREQLRYEQTETDQR